MTTALPLEEKQDATENPLNVKSLGKAFAILEAFSGHERTMSLSEISAATGLDRSAAQRFTYTLKAHGYLEQEITTRRYALGKKVLGFAFNFLRVHPLVEKASPVMTELRRSLGERVDLTLVDGNALLYVLRMRTKRESLAHAHIGCHVPMYCSAGGRAVLARYPQSRALEIIESSQLVAYTPKTKTNPKAILKELEKARRDGYALQSGEWKIDELVIGAAITDRQGTPLGAIHVAASASEWAEADFIKHVVPQLLAVSNDLSGQ